MIVYSKKGGKLTVKLIFEIENVPDDADLNKAIAYGLATIGKRVLEKKEKMLNSDEVGVF
jgi:hypothetical protein